MPCYDPGDGPGPFEAGEAKKRERALRQDITRYVDTLQEIEMVCKAPLPHPEVLPQMILGIIDSYWGQKDTP